MIRWLYDWWEWHAVDGWWHVHINLVLFLPLQLHFTQLDNDACHSFFSTICYQPLAQCMGPMRPFCHNAATNRQLVLAQHSLSSSSTTTIQLPRASRYDASWLDTPACWRYDTVDLAIPQYLWHWVTSSCNTLDNTPLQGTLYLLHASTKVKMMRWHFVNE